MNRSLPVLLLLLSACGPSKPEPGCADAAVDASPQYRIRGITLAPHADGGVTLAYGRYCDGCAETGTYEVLAIDPTTEADKLQNNPLYTGSSGTTQNPLANGREDRLVAGGGTAGGTTVIAIDTDAEPKVALLGGALPGGAVISAAVSSRRPPHPTSMGTLTRSGQLVMMDDSTARMVVSEGTSLAVFQFDKTGAATKQDSPIPTGATSAVIAYGNGSVAYAWTDAPIDQDGTVSVVIDNGSGAAAVSAPTKGVPAALWTDGTTHRLAVKHADSIAYLWDGKTELPLPRSDETACTAIAFNAKGQALFLHAGPKSTVLYLQNGSVMEPHLLSTRDSNLSDVFGCAVGIQDDTVHVAYTVEDHLLEYDQRRFTSVSNVLKPRHDTAKNSVSNIR